MDSPALHYIDSYVVRYETGQGFRDWPLVPLLSLVNRTEISGMAHSTCAMIYDFILFVCL